ncbi:Protein HGH1 [Sphaceloma murrayae]|uniref:Protein HGH1 homolog n=1 Tax=Sphaceloma murrayae TaxID=2082308 RepID=A0A2K1QLC2_9PEZI|nr:Protein HGH1 [Sphaceloma murrayae]
MPTEIEELVEFLHHGNTQIRQVAAENLLGFSTSKQDLFKRNQLEPIRDLKLLIKDYPPIAQNAITMLINLSEDAEILKTLVSDTKFVESVFTRLSSQKEATSNLLSMLLPNLTKSKPFALSLLKLDLPASSPLPSTLALDRLLDLFVRGAAGTHNPAADYDYLSYTFADITLHAEGRKHLLTPRSEPSGPVLPLSKLVVFTEHASDIRRRGVASTIKNICFDVPCHNTLLAPESQDGLNLLPYLLLPLMGSEEYADEDTDGLPEECQLLDDGKKRETDVEIIKTHLETLLLLTTTREGRDVLRAKKVYPVLRELHIAVEDEGVREGADRLVQVIMRDEEGEGEDEVGKDQRILEVDEEDELVEVL